MKLPVDTYMYNQPYVTTMSFDSRVEGITLTRQKVRSFHKRGTRENVARVESNWSMLREYEKERDYRAIETTRR